MRRHSRARDRQDPGSGSRSSAPTAASMRPPYVHARDEFHGGSDEQLDEPTADHPYPILQDDRVMSAFRREPDAVHVSEVVGAIVAAVAGRSSPRVLRYDGATVRSPLRSRSCREARQRAYRDHGRHDRGAGLRVGREAPRPTGSVLVELCALGHHGIGRIISNDRAGLCRRRQCQYVTLSHSNAAPQASGASWPRLQHP